MSYILDKLYSEHMTLVNKNWSIKYFEKFGTQQIYNATKKEELTKKKKKKKHFGGYGHSSSFMKWRQEHWITFKIIFWNPLEMKIRPRFIKGGKKSFPTPRWLRAENLIIAYDMTIRHFSVSLVNSFKTCNNFCQLRALRKYVTFL